MRVEQLLERSAQALPDKAAVVCGARRCSYGELDAQANRLARALADVGVRRSDRVAICLDDSIETIVSIFGVLKAGAAFMVVSPQPGVAQLTSVLADSGAAVLITRAATMSVIQQEWPGLAQLQAVFMVGASSVSVVPALRTLAYEAAVNGGGHASAVPVAVPLDESDLAALIYTSGSTGGLKGVMLSHRNLTFAAGSIGSYLEHTSEDVILNVLPLAFSYGLGQVTTAFRAGATLVLEHASYARVVLDTLAREQVTGLPLIPTLATLLLQQDLSRHDFQHLRYITNAAAALSAGKLQRLRDAFPGVAIYSMYGLTECQRACYLPPDRLAARPSAVGIPIPGTEAFVVDGDGRRVTPGTIGELVVRGPHVMKGYWNRPEETAKRLRPGPVPGEPLLYTDDLFRMDEEGLLYFVERRDDIIKTCGEKVAPRMVEEVIALLSGVAEVAVYGIPDDVLGEAVAAVVTLAPGAALECGQVQRHCREHLAGFMVPKTIEVRAALPLTVAGKVSRHALRLSATSGGPPRLVDPAPETAAA